MERKKLLLENGEKSQEKRHGKGCVCGGKWTDKFSIDDDTWKVISSQDATIEIKLEPQMKNGDTYLYVSRHPLLFPTHHVGSMALMLSMEDHNFRRRCYSIGVYGFKVTSKFRFSVTIQDSPREKVGQHAASCSSSMEVDTIECGNCKRCISSRTITLHEAYCSRHSIICQHPVCGIVLRMEEAKIHVHCKKCGHAFHGVEIDKHVKVFHEPLHCPCGIVLEKEQMVMIMLSASLLSLLPT
ncbi:unnamed protein product [Fraxinus pennsylvanica]|uniref:Uncharacterized protein n=1 Tax=Fraxinus pennsylvanica TaxID=56036 RepID=A0AAD1YQC0_9LAMI|nr:unnamed protein product [Fraxinus pennsylvanica]